MGARRMHKDRRPEDDQISIRGRGVETRTRTLPHHATRRLALGCHEGVTLGRMPALPRDWPQRADRAFSEDKGVSSGVRVLVPFFDRATHSPAPAIRLARGPRRVGTSATGFGGQGSHAMLRLASGCLSCLGARASRRAARVVETGQTRARVSSPSPPSMNALPKMLSVEGGSALVS